MSRDRKYPDDELVPPSTWWLLGGSGKEAADLGAARTRGRGATWRDAGVTDRTRTEDGGEDEEARGRKRRAW